MLKRFSLTSKQTDCLAKDKYGIPEDKTSLNPVNLKITTCYSPKGNCC
ncbi:DUF6428 family protein [Ancylomarina sp. 16SWW S1-10-2]